MSATRLLVLGVVRVYGRAHGYQVRRELLSWAADRWANVKPGSIYHALRKAARDGLLAEIGTEEGDAGPERTVYQLTPDGETEFHVLLGNSLAYPSRGTEELSAAMTFLTALTRKQAIALLQYRIVALEGEHASAEHALESFTDIGKPEHVKELYRLWLSTGDARIAWTRQLVERLEAGAYTMADDSRESFGSPPANRDSGPRS